MEAGMNQRGVGLLFEEREREAAEEREKATQAKLGEGKVGAVNVTAPTEKGETRSSYRGVPVR